MVKYEEFYQTNNIEYIKNRLGSEIWITVYENRKCGNKSVSYWCALIPKRKVAEILNNYTWDFLKGSGMPGCTEVCSFDREEVTYNRFGSDRDGIEPFIYYRNFAHRGECLEVIEEFRLLHNLYHDKRNDIYYYIDESSDEDQVIRITDNKVEVKLKYLKQFLGIKEMSLALYFEMDYYSDQEMNDKLNENVGNDFLGELIRYNLYFQNIEWGQVDKKSLSRLIGKKIIMGYEKSKCGIWPFEEELQYEDYIFGVNSEGMDMKFTCDPKKLSNYFGANQGAPDYLTPIFFRREVLQKYYTKPEIYKVEDGVIYCSDKWVMRLDNHNKDYVNVYLGDLGTDIPFKEQQYWKSFNIIPDGKISDVKFKRDFLSQFIDPELPDLKFKSKYKILNQKWKEKYGWELFLELNEKDVHNFESLRIPLTNDQSEFDGLVLSLVKVFIDSLNESQISKQLINVEDNLKGIAKFERFLCQSGFVDVTEHTKFLKSLQSLRSTGIGHRKGKGYEKIAADFNIGESDLKNVYSNILEKAIALMEFLDKSI